MRQQQQLQRQRRPQQNPKRMRRRRRQQQPFASSSSRRLLLLIFLVVGGAAITIMMPIAASASASTSAPATTFAPMIAFWVNIIVPQAAAAAAAAAEAAASAVESDDRLRLGDDDDDDVLLEELPRPPLASGDDEHHGDEEEEDTDEEDVVDGSESLEEEEHHHRHDSEEEDESSSSSSEGEEAGAVSAGDDDDHDDDDASGRPTVLLQLTLDAFTSADKYQALFSNGRSRKVGDDNDDPRTLVLALVVHDDDDKHHGDSSCPHTQPMLEAFRLAASQLQHIPTLRLGILPLRDATSMRALGIDRIPSLVFVTWLNDDDSDGSGSVVLMEYNGLWTTSDDIAQTATHYWHRLVDATSGWDVMSSTSTTNSNSNTVSVKVPHYDSYEELQHYLRTSQLLNPTIHPRVLVPLPPTLSDGDIRFVRWLLREEDDHEQVEGGPYSLPDDSKLFVQCRQRSSMEQVVRSAPAEDAYRMFDQASRALSNRRECFFAAVENCGSDHHPPRTGDDSENDTEHDQDGTVAAFSIPYDWDYEYMDLVTNLDPKLIRHRPNSNEPNIHHASASVLIHDIAQFARPSVLWFDRQSTAPIVFGHQQQHHAVLVVDMHPVMTGSVNVEEEDGTETSTTNRRADDMRSVRNVFNQFRRECRKPANRHVACLVVPSTETRVLTTLGIDIWTPLDDRVFSATSRQRHPLSSSVDAASSIRPLPVLIMTDREKVAGKTLRYRLNREQLLLGDGTGLSISKFFDDFVSHRLEPVVKSDPRGPRTNAAGVRILTGDSLHELVWEEEEEAEGVDDTDSSSSSSRHALILFVSPTCGHCKRASVVWDRLSRFLNRVHWSSIVQLYKMDVTENDVPDGVTPRWLPDAYHYDRSSRTTASGGNSGSTFTRFDWIQDDGGGTPGDETGGGRGDFDEYALSSAFGIDWDVPTLLNWFVSVTNWTDAELSDLLNDLEKEQQPQ